jgi:cell division protein FtsB
MDASQLVSVYIKIRDAKEIRKKQMEAEIADLDQQLDAVEQQIKVLDDGLLKPWNPNP